MNFPNTPSEGATYTAPNGAQYTFTGGVWMQVAAAQIQLTANPDNILVNGGFQISQEHGNTSIGNGSYPADQWQISGNVGTPSAARAFYTNRYGVISGSGTVVASVAAADYMVSHFQEIEGLRFLPLKWGTADAIPAVLNFKILVGKNGTWSVALRDSVNGRCIAFDLPYVTTEGTKEFTIAIPPTTSGDFKLDQANLGGSIAFGHVAGANYKAPANGVWGNGNYIGGPGITNNAATTGSLILYDVGLYPDPYGTGVAPKFRLLPYDDELRACQRYWQKLDAIGMIWSAPQTATAMPAYSGRPLPVTMRGTPQFSGVNANNQSFPATVGTLAGNASAVWEQRNSNAVSGSTFFYSHITCNARM